MLFLHFFSVWVEREETEACQVAHRGLSELVVEKTTDTPEVYWFETLPQLSLPFHFYTCVKAFSKKKQFCSEHSPLLQKHG